MGSWSSKSNQLNLVSIISAVDNFFVDVVQYMLVKFGVPKNQKVYRYDYHVKKLTINVA